MSAPHLACTPTDLGLIAAAILNGDRTKFDFRGRSDDELARILDNIESLIDALPADEAAAEALLVRDLGNALLSTDLQEP